MVVDQADRRSEVLVDQADCKSGCSTTILGRLIEDQKCSRRGLIVNQGALLRS